MRLIWFALMGSNIGSALGLAAAHNLFWLANAAVSILLFAQRKQWCEDEEDPS